MVISNTRLENERISKKNAQELAEELDTLGQDSDERAVKWVQEKQKELDTEEVKETNKEKEILHDKRKYKKNEYFLAILRMAKRKLAEFDVPNGYRVDAILKENKVIIGLRKDGFRWYAKGMVICGEPKYDMNCIERLVIQCMIALDELYDQHEKHTTKSGIVLPNTPGAGNIITK